MHTADRFQGRDKEVIILSLVRSNENQSIGELLRDWRRINVAFTRAKTKLLVIGSRETLKGNGPNVNTGEEEMVAKFVKLMEVKDWVFDLPPTALDDHLFEDGQTQFTASIKNARAATQQPQKKEEKGNEGFKIEKRRSIADVLDEGKVNKENTAVRRIGLGLGGVKRQPNKKVFGNKPFKIPQMSVLKDIVNENLY